MDLKDDKKSLKFREHPQLSERYLESKAGHVFVNNVNPFDTVGGYAGDIRENRACKRKNEEFINIFNKTQNRKPFSQSKELVDDIIKNCGYNNHFDDHMFVNERYDEMHETFFVGNCGPFSQPKVSMSANVFGTEYTSCSKDVPKNQHYDHRESFNGQNNKRYRASSTNEIVSGPAAETTGPCEKTTYCRPLLNMYNQEFIYKTMQRNIKLQKLVRRLVIAREREKQRESWNNYINDLKNKHGYYSNEPSKISPQYVPGDQNNIDIDDNYDRRYHWRQSQPYQHLLDDIYGMHHNVAPANARYPHDHGINGLPYIQSIYDSDRLCYPTSSQANMLRWNKERTRSGYGYNWQIRPSGRYRGNAIMVEKDLETSYDMIQGTYKPCPSIPRFMRKSRITSKPIQTESNLPLVNEEDNKLKDVKPETQEDKDVFYPYVKNTDSKNQKDSHKNKKDVHGKQGESKTDKDNISSKLKDSKNKMTEKGLSKPKSINDTKAESATKLDSFKEKFQNVTDNITKIKNKIRLTEEATKLKSLADIEEKIDVLMKSINSIMLDIKSKKTHLLSRKTATVSACTVITTSITNLSRPKSDPYGYLKSEEYVCDIVRSSSKSLTISEIPPSDIKKQRDSSISRMDKILLEELKKSEIVKRDIAQLLNMRNERNCSVQITFDIPTKEISTEVTDSLSRARLETRTTVVEEITTPGDSDMEHRQMTIAVNTDPLGLLALLRVSTETIKQLLSYMPNLNYCSYFSMLPIPTRQCVSHYICNICGAAFGRPSQLSDHIERHNLGKKRDCCVCRHTLDMKHTRLGLFACRHCGQRFTRAYCCELHQQTCARQLGRPHEVSSSHLLLK